MNRLTSFTLLEADLEHLSKECESQERRKLEPRAFTELLSVNKMESVFALLSRSYWQRLWIIQELMFAKSPVLYCGKPIANLGSL